MQKEINWNGESWIVDPTTRTIYKKGQIYENDSELLTAGLKIGNHSYSNFGDIIYFQRNTDNECFKVENDTVVNISKEEYLEYKKMKRIILENPDSIRYVMNYVIAIICDDILKREYQLKVSIPVDNSNVVPVVSKNFSEIIKSKIKEVTTHIMIYLPGYIDRTQAKKVIYDCFVKTLEENPEYVENIEKKIIQENKPVFDALAEQIKSSIESRKKMDEISQSRNLQMGEKSLHERNYDRFQQIARDRISGNRHKPTLSEITEKTESESKGRKI